jgi:Apea-like HEPN
MTKTGINRDNSGQIRPLARAFLEAYQAASVQTDEDYLRVIKGDTGYHHFEGGLIELTDQLVKATDALIDKAIKMIGPKGASERALQMSAEEVGRNLVRGFLDLDTAVAKLIDQFAEESTGSFEVILPNYVIDFTEGIRSVDMGRVRAALSEDVSAELGRRDIPILIEQGADLCQTGRDKKIVLTLPRSCWVVKVAAARDNAQEEAKWLIDVAISLIRMAYRIVGPMFPVLGDVEPHPTLPWHLKNVSATIGSDFTTGGAHGIIKSYEIDRQIELAITDPAFLARAKLIFDPAKGSLAERMNQGLGWLTRGRQTSDRAERLLFNFTAIEALLSTADKTAPVTQTIARHAAAILTDDAAARANTAQHIRELYELRSAVVHAGSRPVAWTQAKQAQNLAEHLFSRVLHRADLSIKYTDFAAQLSVASYGSPWPQPDKTSVDEGESGKPATGESI